LIKRAESGEKTGSLPPWLGGILPKVGAEEVRTVRFRLKVEKRKKRAGMRVYSLFYLGFGRGLSPSFRPFLPFWLE